MCVVEFVIGMMCMEIYFYGGLYVSVILFNLMVGIVGGGIYFFS